jgi:hypothetical protein
MDCPDCNGLGRHEDWWGCSDPACCGTDMCFTCEGSGEVEEDFNKDDQT